MSGSENVKRSLAGIEQKSNIKSAAILLRVSSGSFLCLRGSSSYCKREERSTKSHEEKSQRNTRKGSQKFQIFLASLMGRRAGRRTLCRASRELALQRCRAFRPSSS